MFNLSSYIHIMCLEMVGSYLFSNNRHTTRHPTMYVHDKILFFVHITTGCKTCPYTIYVSVNNVIYSVEILPKDNFDDKK